MFLQNTSGLLQEYKALQLFILTDVRTSNQYVFPYTSFPSSYNYSFSCEYMIASTEKLAKNTAP
jgi:hypothetical protein